MLRLELIVDKEEKYGERREERREERRGERVAVNVYAFYSQSCLKFRVVASGR
jgi:hypothetical protein